MTEKWAPRVPMEWIDKLYRTDAQGIVDDELIDKVGWRLHARCEDCISATSSAMSQQPDPKGRSWQHQELITQGALPFFEEFIAAWDGASDPRAKMLAIDRVIHRWHWENADERPIDGAVGRPTGVNLIEGSRKQVIAFLDRLSAGENHESWKALRP